MPQGNGVSSIIRSANGPPPSAEGGKGVCVSKARDGNTNLRAYPRSCASPCKASLKGEVPALGGQRGSFPAPHGRGGSVSRRDHNQAYRRSTQLTGGTNYAEATNSNASRSSGGSAREGLLSEKPPPSHILVFVILFGRGGLGERRFSQRSGLSPSSVPYRLFGREREGGCFSTEKHPPSHILSPLSLHFSLRLV